MLLHFKIFFSNLIQTFETILRILFLSKFSIAKTYRKSEELVVLGNGPSLNNMLKNHSKFLEYKDLTCVNAFPLSNFYEVVRPTFLVLVAPEFWIDNVDDEYKKMRSSVYRALVEKTSWPITILMPHYSKQKMKEVRPFDTNKNIQISYFNTVPIEGFVFFRNICFKLKLGMPRPHNVLIPSLMCGIWANYKSIYVWGADHSWLPEISVDDDNRVLIHQKHFYDQNSSKPDIMKNRGKGQRKLHEVLHKFMVSFEGYFSIQSFAEVMNVQILNNTPKSFIDAFKRQKI